MVIKKIVRHFFDSALLQVDGGHRENEITKRFYGGFRKKMA